MSVFAFPVRFRVLIVQQLKIKKFLLADFESMRGVKFFCKFFQDIFDMAVFYVKDQYLHSKLHFLKFRVLITSDGISEFPYMIFLKRSSNRWWSRSRQMDRHGNKFLQQNKTTPKSENVPYKISRLVLKTVIKFYVYDQVSRFCTICRKKNLQSLDP